MSIAAGNKFSMALCEEGHVYAWGPGLGLFPDYGFNIMEPTLSTEIE